MTNPSNPITHPQPTISLANPRPKDPYERITSASTEELIELMDQESEEAERQKLLDEMTPACREKLKFIDHWLRNESGHDLRRRYELGLQVLELYQDQTTNGARRYGRHAIDRICKVLNWDDGLIRLSLKFVQRFTPEHLEQLCATSFPNGRPISWSHVRCLLTVEDLPRRQVLLEQTVTEGWTCTDLMRAVKELSYRPEDGRGRPPTTPKDFDTFVAHELCSTEQWERSYGRLYSNPKCSLVTHAARLTSEQVTSDRLREARDLAMQLRHVAGQALKQAEMVEQVIRNLEVFLDPPHTSSTKKETTGMMPQ